MADNNMSAAEQNKLRAHLSTVAANFRCPVCGGRHIEPLAHLSTFSGVTEKEGGIVNVNVNLNVPVALTYCSTCYYILPFAALPIGLLPKASAAQEAKEAATKDAGAKRKSAKAAGDRDV